MSVKIGEASPKGRMDQAPRGGGGSMRGGGQGGFPGAGFDNQFGSMGFGGAQGGFSGGDPMYFISFLGLLVSSC